MSNAFIIDDMTWSYQRLSQFQDCKYAWYLKYIKHLKDGKPQFFQSYGTFIHEVLELILSGQLSKDEAIDYFLDHYDEKVQGEPPSKQVADGFFDKTLSYLQGFSFPYTDILATEKEVRFELDGKPFVGYIDVLARDGNDLLIIDHKSHGLRERSGRATPTKYDMELDDYLRQQYLYSIPIYELFGQFPSALSFNCYRFGRFIKEPFDKARLEETKQWALQRIQDIREEKLWEPSPDYFKCQYICDCSSHCEYCPKQKGRRFS